MEGLLGRLTEVMQPTEQQLFYAKLNSAPRTGMIQGETSATHGTASVPSVADPPPIAVTVTAVEITSADNMLQEVTAVEVPTSPVANSPSDGSSPTVAAERTPANQNSTHSVGMKSKHLIPFSETPRIEWRASFANGQYNAPGRKNIVPTTHPSNRMATIATPMALLHT